MSSDLIIISLNMLFNLVSIHDIMIMMYIAEIELRSSLL
jgi:hypothetical protein